MGSVLQSTVVRGAATAASQLAATGGGGGVQVGTQTPQPRHPDSHTYVRSSGSLIHTVEPATP